MKKIMLCGAVALAGIISSCSSDETLSSNNQNSDLQEIKIGFGANTVVSTRGTGTVGSTDGGTNSWNGQKINIFLLERGTTNLALFENEGAIYDNEVFVAPIAMASGIALPEDNRVKYYPTQGAFDFWGYRLDGCETGPYTASADKIEIPFTMDGSQDIMVGKAVPTDEEKAACKKDGGEPEPDRIYSAFAARRNIQPNITFKHLLSRLTFSVLAGNRAICDPDGVKVTAIEVVSKNSGKLIAAYTGSEIDQIVFDDTETNLILKQRATGAATNENLVDLEPVTPEWNDEGDVAQETAVGEALLVAPSAEYKLIIRLSQTVKTDYSDPSATTVKEFAYEDVLNTAGGFLAGKSYNVKITVYGLSEIKVNTTLTPWVDGGNIDMIPEDNGRPTI